MLAAAVSSSDPLIGIGTVLVGVGSVLAACVAFISAKRGHRKLDEINHAVNNVDLDTDPRPLWQRVDDLADGVTEVRTTQATTLHVLDSIVDRRAIDGKAIRELTATLRDMADLKDVIREANKGEQS